MLGDCKGAPSTMRVLSCIVIINIMAVWSYLSITTATFIQLDYDIIFLILGVLGVKAYQRKIEGESCEKEPKENNEVKYEKDNSH